MNREKVIILQDLAKKAGEMARKAADSYRKAEERNASIMDKKLVASELVKVAKSLIADDKGHLVFYIESSEERSKAEKNKAKLDKYISSTCGGPMGEYEYTQYMGTIGVNCVAVPIDFDVKSHAIKIMREVKHDPEAKKLKITVEKEDM